MSPLLITLIAFIPSIGMFLGGLAGSFFILRPKYLSILQHFTSGVVFAAVAVELLPRISKHYSPISVVVGFLIGVIAMMFVKLFTIRLEKASTLGLTFAVGIDLFIDGLLIGVAFIAGRNSGFAVTIAFAVEMITLGLSTTGILGAYKATRKQRIIEIFILIFLLPIGALVGSAIISLFAPSWLTGTLAFGVAALLYLVTEELLAKAHQIKEGPWVTGVFFLGFLIIFLLGR